jgi:DNA-binding MarR family transcriptional regulator
MVKLKTKQEKQQEFYKELRNLDISFIQYKIWLFLKYNPNGLTRKQLVEKTELPRTTIYDNLEKLENKGYVKRESRNNCKVGRSKVYWINLI